MSFDPMSTSTTPPGALIHIAAQPIQIGPQLRQRCGWCGAVLLDYPLDRMAVPVDQAGEGPATWETGVLVGVHGGVHWLVDHVDGEKLPPEACAQLPHDVTGATP